MDRFLATYSNLSIDISALHATNPYAREKNPITDAQGALTPEWKALLLRHQDRVFVGSDTPFSDQWEKASPVSYRNNIQGQRGILRQLPGEVAEKIAFRNAARVLNLSHPGRNLTPRWSPGLFTLGRGDMAGTLLAPYRL